MNRDLFLAILAMDAYNRGYGQGINGLNPFGQLGTASIKNDLFILGGTVTDRIDVRSGFYAIAYDVSGVEGLSGTVISYRGTDKLGSFPWTPEGSDVVNGWPLGGGYYMADQAQLAAQFYNKVIGPETSLIGSGTTLTGHSLGGGLVRMAANDDSCLIEHRCAA